MPKELSLVALIITAMIALCSALMWLYIHARRHRSARSHLQNLVAAALRDTNQGTFLFIVSRTAKSVEVRLCASAEELSTFKNFLAMYIHQNAPEVEISVAPLTEDLSYLGDTVAVWGIAHGSVVVARGHPVSAA